ncbi:putative efflux protein, MATE family [Treponema bryantii]|uniref:Putative efflux protein, MATE family n=2 Tax=Treponema bryantii TaxID=163 RepID=A0A1H9CSB0_9SPIR|nr:putative efflux protein, MATE family [Treponema bryantii]
MINMTEGSPVRLLLTFSVPMLNGNIFQQLYNLADSVIVGQLIGAHALAAIGATGSVTFFFFALCNGIGTGGGIITSHFFGEGNDEKVKVCIVNTAFIMVLVPLVIGTVAFFTTKPLLVFLKTPESILDEAAAYMKIMCCALPLISIYNFVSSMLRALGDSKTPLYFLIFSCILNVILDIIFVYFLHQGVVGAGIATLIANFVCGLLCLTFAFKTNPYFKLHKKDVRLDANILWKCTRLGVPISLQFSLIAISCMALQRVVNNFGPVTVAAFTATSRIEQLIHQPYQTLGAALSTFSGQNFGAKKKDRLILGYRKSMLMMTIFTLVMIPIIQIFGNGVTRVFVKDAEVISMGAQALRISSWFYIFLGLIYMVRGVLNGVGDATFSLINGITEVIGRFTVPIALTSIAAIGVWGIWWSVGIVWFLSGFTAYLRYLWVKNKKI